MTKPPRLITPDLFDLSPLFGLLTDVPVDAAADYVPIALLRFSINK